MAHQNSPPSRLTATPRAMTSARNRRLASPVRLVLAMELGADLDGAWWPRTGALAPEFPELIEVMAIRLGEVVDISVNWSALAGSPDLDTPVRVPATDPSRVVGRQRLMAIAGRRASANILVIPCRTSSALAVMVLRQAADLPVAHLDCDTPVFRSANAIVCAARAESARCAARPHATGLRYCARP